MARKTTAAKQEQTVEATVAAANDAEEKATETAASDEFTKNDGKPTEATSPADSEVDADGSDAAATDVKEVANKNFPEIKAEAYPVVITAANTQAQFVNLRDTPDSYSDDNISFTVGIGSRAYAIAELGDWTLLIHGLYVMTKFVKKL